MYLAIIDAIHFGKICMFDFKLDQPTKRQDGSSKKYFISKYISYVAIIYYK
jgi:hypothetical protein